MSDFSNQKVVDPNSQEDTTEQPWTQRPLTIGIVAGEQSGDRLGASLMQQFNQLHRDIRWVGVGGAQMQAQGLTSIAPMETLAVMGLVEVLGRLPTLVKLKRQLVRHFTQVEIDLFVGIDAPDFNLRLAKTLKQQHQIFCVQYVSPSVWAWRQERIHSIKAATHLVLCLFPFETKIYEDHHHPAAYVGHPLLTEIDADLVNADQFKLRRELIWQQRSLRDFFTKKDVSEVIGILPGSREGEVRRLLPLLLDSAERLLVYDADMRFIVPAANNHLQHLIGMQIAERSKTLQEAMIVVCDDRVAQFSLRAIAACDMIIVASGTVTFEALLLAKPMVVVYKINPISYRVVKSMMQIEHYALPNILAGQPVVTELMQDDATPESITKASLKLLRDDTYDRQKSTLIKLRNELYQQANRQAVHYIVDEWLTHPPVSGDDVSEDSEA